MVENKLEDDTFLQFGEGNKIAGEGEPNINLGDDAVKHEEDKMDFSGKSFSEILDHFKISLVPNNEVNPNFSSELYTNRYNKFYPGEYTNFGICSIVVLNDINENKQDFTNLLVHLGKLSSINASRSLKLLGVSLFDNKAYLIFEPISSSLSKKIRESAIENNGKYIGMFYIIELTMQLHEKNISISDVKDDTILYNKNNEFRYLVPFSNIK